MVSTQNLKQKYYERFYANIHGRRLSNFKYDS